MGCGTRKREEREEEGGKRRRRRERREKAGWEERESRERERLVCIRKGNRKKETKREGIDIQFSIPTYAHMYTYLILEGNSGSL